MMEMHKVDFSGACALVIGIASYQHVRPLPKVDDAKAISEVLLDNELCGYGKVTTLEEEKATKQAILHELDELANEPTKTAVLIYFSGHGGRIDEGEYQGQYLLPVEAIYSSDAELARTAIDGKLLTEKLGGIAKRTRQLTVILDCCHAGVLVEDEAVAKDLTVVGMHPGLSPGFLEKEILGKAQVILAAAIDKAYVYQDDQYGAFTKHLLNGLRGEAGGSGGIIRVTELYNYIQERLASEKAKQRPFFKAAFEIDYPIVRHLGSKAGSGITITTGLEVLSRLIGESALVRQMVSNIKNNLEAEREQINSVALLKSLHDRLHELQAHDFREIQREQELLPAIARAWPNLTNLADWVKSRAEVLRSIATMVYPEEEAMEWVDELVERGRATPSGRSASRRERGRRRGIGAQSRAEHASSAGQHGPSEGDSRDEAARAIWRADEDWRGDGAGGGRRERRAYLYHGRTGPGPIRSRDHRLDGTARSLAGDRRGSEPDR